MKSKISTPRAIQNRVLSLIEKQPRYNDVLPERFISLLENNHATTDELDEDGLYKRSPLVVALGDSVTAGWFEGNTRFPRDVWERYFAKDAPVEHITDVACVYHEQFRLMLADRYARSSLSVINSGISGDTAGGMRRRLHRDVVRYEPNLILLHASLNGPENVNVYTRELRELVESIRKQSEAEIVVLTPNLVIEEAMGTLDARVGVMLEIAETYHLCVANQYETWRCVQESGIDVRHLLSNGLNHPTAFGHRIAALELMKLFTVADG